jgi:peptidoglycan/xylan/chitin deacetylase (PgdA/CDA1 family)
MRRDGITFGAHTVTHPILSRVSAAEAEREMRESRDKIQAQLDEAVQLFAYPNGGPLDFDESHKRLAESLGFKAAFTTIHGLNGATTDLFECRRGGPDDPAAPDFALKLALYRFQS